MTNLDGVFKSRDITLLRKVCIVKAMVFLVVMYGCESWTRSEERRVGKEASLFSPAFGALGSKPGTKVLPGAH